MSNLTPQNNHMIVIISNHRQGNENELILINYKKD